MNTSKDSISPFLLSTILSIALSSPLLAQGTATESNTTSAPPVSATRQLFNYHRDDATAGHITNIQINAAHTATAPVQQNVFGNFLEHLGGVVYEGVWAEVLLNPNLERIEPQETAPQSWDFNGAATWQDNGYLSPRCVRLSGTDGTLSQRVFLPTHRIRNYSFSFYTRVPNGSGQITLVLHAGDDLSGPVVQTTALTVTGATWQLQKVHWSLPARGLNKGEPARLAIRHTGGSDVDVDQIEIFPDDAVHGLDPDVLRAARAWHIPILRLAGNFSSGYHWQQGVGLHVARPTLRNPAWGGAETNHFGTDEFLEFSRQVGAVPQIAVNAGNGTAEEAAAWVHYCNDRSFQVPIWEIGNELYGGWQIGHTDAAGNAERFVRFRDAMLQADRRIKIIATGKGDEFLPDGVGRDLAWNEAVLRAAMANGGQIPDYISIHPLVGLSGPFQGTSYAETYESAMAHPAFLDQTLLPALAQQIINIEGPQIRTRIAPTEWGIIIGGDRWAEGPNHDVLAGAIFNALTLNAFLRHSDWVTLANMTALMHGGGIKKPNGVVMVDPQYYTQQLYALAAPRIPVETTWSGPGRDVPARSFLPAASNVPDVDVFSALSADRSRLTAFLVNRNLTETRPIRLNVNGFNGHRVSATILTAPDIQARNTWEHPDTVAPHAFPVPAASTLNTTPIMLPPHSLVVLTVQH
ncbi:MAG: hypothetical protein JO316_18655 [Abitibacteriaceae bacterium]|nr:hypothetical protein [Abditibacteriaceae bacterium]